MIALSLSSLPVGVDAAFKVEFTGEGGAVLYLSEGASREKLLGDLSSTIAKALVISVLHNYIHL